MDRRPNLFCLWVKRPYLSLWPPRWCPTDGSLSSTLFPSYQFPKETLKIHQTCEKMAPLQPSTVFRLTGVNWRMLCQRDNIPEDRNMWRTGLFRVFFLFHRCPVDNLSKDSIVSNKRGSDSFSSCLFTRSAVNNQHLREFPDALCQSLGKKKKRERAQLWQQPQAPVIAPSHPRFRQMTELSNPPANQLITATIGN